MKLERLQVAKAIGHNTPNKMRSRLKLDSDTNNSSTELRQRKESKNRTINRGDV